MPGQPREPRYEDPESKVYDAETVFPRAATTWMLNGDALPLTFFAETTAAGFYSHVSLRQAILIQVSGRCPAARWSGASTR
jgi:hypothetical protein